MKTSRATAKRVRLTGRGKIRRARACKSHLLTKKTTKRKRRLRRPQQASPGDARRMRVLLRMR